MGSRTAPVDGSRGVPRGWPGSRVSWSGRLVFLEGHDQHARTAVGARARCRAAPVEHKPHCRQASASGAIVRRFAVGVTYEHAIACSRHACAGAPAREASPAGLRARTARRRRSRCPCAFACSSGMIRSASAARFTQRGTRPPRTAYSSEPTRPKVLVRGRIAARGGDDARRVVAGGCALRGIHRDQSPGRTTRSCCRSR